jgi:asparagine synthase (glutamine-hydrolysing)
MIISVSDFFQTGDLYLGLKAMQHRGDFANTSRVVHAGDYMLGHLRLAVRGLDKQYNQPFSYGNDVGVFVGEVFNIPGENDAIEAVGRLIDFGPEVAKTFDGFFSVAYTRRGELYVQTDHLGIKPLYYDETTGIIASELSAIIALNGFLQPDPLYKSAVLKWGYDVTCRTPFKRVRRIAPGTVLVFNQGRLRQEYQYWVLEPKEGSLDILIRDAVRDRMVSDIPVATLCSGGLDSTIVTMLAAEINPYIQVFHVENEERGFFEQVPLPSTVQKIPLNLDSSIPFEDAVRAAGVPVDLGSVVPQYAMACAVAAEGINVVLSGDGADELFGGYRRSKEYDSQYSDIFQELPAYHLPRLDTIMMSKTIELRSPFLAPRVIEAALAIPYEGWRTEKQVLKKYFCDLVPESIYRREKKPLKTSAVSTGGVAYRKMFYTTWSDLKWPYTKF